MSDRELLELAAKAVGIESSIGLLPKDGVSIIQPSGDKWNPLTDDGDALRLAVKLNLDIRYEFYDSNTAVLVGGKWDGAPEALHELFEGRHDPYAATRRAIVRAAAEIGRTMK